MPDVRCRNLDVRLSEANSFHYRNADTVDVESLKTNCQRTPRLYLILIPLPFAPLIHLEFPLSFPFLFIRNQQGEIEERENPLIMRVHLSKHIPPPSPTKVPPPSQSKEAAVMRDGNVILRCSLRWSAFPFLPKSQPSATPYCT